ncbi:MAG: hypothetical protein HLUCCO18_03445 [Rhodobacteraceae bacterium HLUCCO18]|nr:MAG: hypothetical protein HLUCCO18_03445 [Rhodobacteraceae bacterium HLUCCO18]
MTPRRQAPAPASTVVRAARSSRQSATTGSAGDPGTSAIRSAMKAEVAALARDGDLRPDLTPERATDLLAGLLSVSLRAHLTREGGWSRDTCVDEIARLAKKALMPDG